MYILTSSRNNEPQQPTITLSMEAAQRAMAEEIAEINPQWDLTPNFVLNVIWNAELVQKSLPIPDIPKDALSVTATTACAHVQNMTFCWTIFEVPEPSKYP